MDNKGLFFQKEFRWTKSNFIFMYHYFCKLIMLHIPSGFLKSDDADPYSWLAILWAKEMECKTREVSVCLVFLRRKCVWSREPGMGKGEGSVVWSAWGLAHNRTWAFILGKMGGIEGFWAKERQNLIYILLGSLWLLCPIENWPKIGMGRNGKNNQEATAEVQERGRWYRPWDVSLLV